MADSMKNLSSDMLEKGQENKNQTQEKKVQNSRRRNSTQGRGCGRPLAPTPDGKQTYCLQQRWAYYLGITFSAFKYFIFSKNSMCEYW